VHGLGRLGVSNAILDKPEPLDAGERERLRMVPYLTGRMLRQSPALAPLGAIALQQYERLDGSGFPHGLAGQAISQQGRILGAAVAYAELRARHPHREPLESKEAAAELRAQVRAGQLDSDAVEAVLAASGSPAPRRRREHPAGLTTREVEVLGLLALGLTNRDVAERLVISRKTVANHVEHIYLKIGVRNRAAAALFATQHDLLVTTDPVGV
jgi:HD-GYP domain-containing protein (c-di-GMP phosphodiesterase class II)